MHHVSLVNYPYSVKTVVEFELSQILPNSEVKQWSRHTRLRDDKPNPDSQMHMHIKAVSFFAFFVGLVFIFKGNINWLCDRQYQSYSSGGCQNQKLPVGIFYTRSYLNHKQWRKILLTEIYEFQLWVVVIDESHTVVKW